MAIKRNSDEIYDGEPEITVVQALPSLLLLLLQSVPFGFHVTAVYTLSSARTYTYIVLFLDYRNIRDVHSCNRNRMRFEYYVRYT